MSFQLFPSFSFNESNVGPRPVRSASVDRIGLVGMFARGPLVPQICDAATAQLIYGFTNDVGSAHLQMMAAQGADSFLINRVLGGARKASLETALTGTATGAGSITVDIKSGGTTVTASVALAGGETAVTIVASMISAINALAGNTYVTATQGGTTSKLMATAKTGGTAGNALQIKWTLNTSTGITFGPGTPTTFTNLTGGLNGPTTSSVNVVDGTTATVMTLTSVWPGATANSIVAVVSAGSDTGKFNVTLTYADENIKEIFRDVDLTDIYDEDKVTAFRGSLLVRAQLGAGTGTPVNGTLNLTGATDGTTVVTQDFNDAIDTLHNYQASILVCPGIKPNGVDQMAIQANLTAQAEAIDAEMGEETGLRIAVGSLPRNSVVADIATYKAANWIPNSKRTAILMGWSTSSKLTKFKRFGIDPAALYAAHLLTTPIQVSPAARSSSPFFVGITEVDTPVGIAAQNEITKNRMDAIINVTGGGFHCLNGRSTSSDGAWYWICYRRVYDKIRQDIYAGFQFSKSEPQNKALDSVIETTANNYLQGLLYDGIINGYNPAVSNDSNNPAPIRAAGQRFVDFGIEMVPPNDQTQFNLNRVLTASIRLA